MFIGIPTVLGGGFALHFPVGVKLWPNTPTLAEPYMLAAEGTPLICALTCFPSLYRPPSNRRALRVGHSEAVFS